jgi:DNA polymerase I-like protein with 3'-5' exonuclease and polymerase domains
MTQELVQRIANIFIERKPIKNINFGLLYGMGESKLARQAGVSKKEAKSVFAGYHEGNPYVSATMEQAANEAQRNGYITTILNRRSRFDMWEPRNINYENRATPLRKELAIRNYGVDIIRSSTHKAINRRLQGSAADIIKKAMWQCHKDGVFRVTGVPKLQVHDELDFSVRDISPEQNEAFAHMRWVLANSIKLRVPVLVDAGRGANWGAID